MGAVALSSKSKEWTMEIPSTASKNPTKIDFLLHNAEGQTSSTEGGIRPISQMNNVIQPKISSRAERDEYSA
jgi:hypothetical protein